MTESRTYRLLIAKNNKLIDTGPIKEEDICPSLEKHGVNSLSQATLLIRSIDSYGWGNSDLEDYAWGHPVIVETKWLTMEQHFDWEKKNAKNKETIKNIL
jgi:hypothetical protein